MSTAATKQLCPSVQEVRENDGSGTSIREALYRLSNARQAARSDIMRIEKERPGLLLTASASEIDRRHVQARQLQTFIEQMGALEPELQRALGATKEVNEQEEYEAELAAIEAEIAAWNADMRAQYDSAIAPLIALMKRERDIRRKCEAVVTMPAYSRLCTSWSRPPNPRDTLMQAASAVAAYDGKRISFAELVQLPRLDGGEESWPRL